MHWVLKAWKIVQSFLNDLSLQGVSIRWNTKLTDTEVLSSMSTPCWWEHRPGWLSYHSCTRWTHTQTAFWGEISAGRCFLGMQKKHFKDILKVSLILLGIDLTTWEKLMQNWSKAELLKHNVSMGETQNIGIWNIIWMVFMADTVYYYTDQKSKKSK